MQMYVVAVLALAGLCQAGAAINQRDDRYEGSESSRSYGLGGGAYGLGGLGGYGGIGGGYGLGGGYGGLGG